MESFIEDLERFELLRFDYSSNKCLNNYTSSNKFKEALIRHFVQKLINYCNLYLIDDECYCNYDNIEIVKNSGFSIGPGERDRFGWLTGILYTKKGFIVYG